MGDRMRVAAAIDFGTHGSGFGWSVIDDLNADPHNRKIHFKDQWQGLRVAYPKNLSAVTVDADGEIASWGFEAKEDWSNRSKRQSLAGYAYAFKMVLGDGGGQGVARAEGSIDLGDKGVVEKLIVGYLAQIYQVAIDEITQSGFLAGEIRWCITVPAIWSQSDREFTRGAAVQAGMPEQDDRLLVIAEPEAAAIYCRTQLAALIEDQPRTAAAGGLDRARFMVIDCGGGTVDITSYRSQAAESGGGFRLAEVGKVTGGKLGSEYVNQAFRTRILADRFGADVLDRLERELPFEVAKMESLWEAAKVRLTVTLGPTGVPRISRTVEIDVPGPLWDALDARTRQSLTDRADGDSHLVLVQADDAQALLDSVVDATIDKVAEQLLEMRANSGQARDEVLLIVGGFARSEYLCERIRARFGEESTIVVPPDPAAAVLFGAVHFCYDPSVLWARRAGLTYGLAMAMPFEPGLDPLEKKIRDDDGRQLCANRFAVAVRAREQVEVDEPFLFSTLPVTRAQTAIVVQLFATRKLDPRYVDDPGSSQLASIEIDMSDLTGRSDADREVKVYLYFGRTVIQVEAVVVSTAQRLKTNTTFTALH